MMHFVKIGCRIIAVSVVLIGIVAIVGGLALGLTAMYRLNLIQAYLPKEQVRQLEVVSVQLSGPRFAVAGDRVYFHATTSGMTGKVSWNIHPYKAGLLTVLPDDSRNAEFTSLEEGKYIITVAAAGEGTQPPATDHMEFENVSLASEQDLQQNQPQQPGSVNAMGGMGNMPPPPPQPQQPIEPLATATELTTGALAMVTSSNKAAEARLVADTVYLLAKQLRAGLLPQFFDIPLEIENRSRKALREHFDDWGPFMVSIDKIIDEMRRQGKVNSSASSQYEVLVEIANVLASAR